MPASLIVGALVSGGYIAAGGLAAAAITLGVRIVTVSVISSLIAKKQERDINAQGISNAPPGGRVQLPPNTNNKIPVIYGTAWAKPIIVDAKISADNQTMWYVMAFSEKTDTGTMTFNRFYWGDRLVNLTGNTVTSFTNSDGTTDTKVNGKVNIYTFGNGSSNPLNGSQTAIDILDDVGINFEDRWDASKKMGGLTFAIVKVQYDANAGITGIPEITAEITNSLTKPGAVIKDYFKNTRYGLGLADANLELGTLTSLDNYSDELIYYTDPDNVTQSAPRFRVNGLIDTSRTFLSNLNFLTDSCDSYVTWNEKDAKWSITVNRPYDPAVAPRRIGPREILSGIDIHPIDLNSTYNSVEVEFPSNDIRDQSSFFTYDLVQFPNYNALRSKYEQDNQLKIQLPFTNNQVEAQYIAARRMLSSRIQMSIQFTMNYSGIQIDAGDVIGIDHDYFGWGSDPDGLDLVHYDSTGATTSTGKLFRVQQVAEQVDSNGSLYCRITAISYDADIYIDSNIELFKDLPPVNTGLADPNFVSTPNAPVVLAETVNTIGPTPTFDVQAQIPNTGVTTALEYWYSTSTALSTVTNNYSLYDTIQPSLGSNFVRNSTVTNTVSGLIGGTYYWRVRAIGTRSKSEFSNASSGFIWTPVVTATITGKNFQNLFSPSTYSLSRSANGTIVYPTVGPRLYGISAGSNVEFVTAQTDSDPLFAPNTWRVGNSTNTGILSISSSGITIASTATVGSDVSGSYAQLGIPSNSTTSTGFISVPSRYKDDLGNVYQGGDNQLIFSWSQQGEQGNKGDQGDQGPTGNTGTNGIAGFVPLAYVPIAFDPNTATQLQLDTAWLTQVGRPAINLDGATFYYVLGGTKQTDINGDFIYRYKTYYTGSGWVNAAFEVAGDLITDGTIRGQTLVANAIYGKSYQSTNATLDSAVSTGTWINGNNGNARFAGSVSIGSNLSVAGLITSGALSADTVTANNIVAGTITREKLAGGTISSQLGIAVVPSAIVGAGGVWTGSFSGVYYKDAGYFQIRIPEQYKPSTSFNIRVTYYAVVTATRSSTGGNLGLYIYANKGLGGRALQASSVAMYSSIPWIGSGGGNPSSFNQAFSDTFTYAINPSTWDSGDDNYINAVVSSEFGDGTGFTFALQTIQFTITII